MKIKKVLNIFLIVFALIGLFLGVATYKALSRSNSSADSINETRAAPHVNNEINSPDETSVAPDVNRETNLLDETGIVPIVNNETDAKEKMYPVDTLYKWLLESFSGNPIKFQKISLENGIAIIDFDIVDNTPAEVLKKSSATVCIYAYKDFFDATGEKLSYVKIHFNSSTYQAAALDVKDYEKWMGNTGGKIEKLYEYIGFMLNDNSEIKVTVSKDTTENNFVQVFDYGKLQDWLTTRFTGMDIEVYSPSEGLAGVNFRGITMNDNEITAHAPEVLLYIFSEYEKVSDQRIYEVKLNYFYAEGYNTRYEYLVIKFNENDFNEWKNSGLPEEKMTDFSKVIKE